MNQIITWMPCLLGGGLEDYKYIYNIYIYILYNIIYNELIIDYIYIYMCIYI